MATKSDGFITADNYAAVPWGKRLVIIFNGQQIGDVSTERQANTFIKNHRVDNPTGVSKFTK
jgi:hypothetical protein